MKPLIPVLLLATLTFFTPGSSTAQTDTGATPVINLPDSIKKLPARVGKLEEKTGIAMAAAAKDSVNKDCGCIVECKNRDLSYGAWFLVFLPVILFFVVAGFFVALILRGKFDLAETLSTGEKTTQTVALAGGGETVVKKPIGSTSRLIAFLTGITAVLVAICLVTFYAYSIIAECSGHFDFDGLWKILLGLGIGVIPYGVNVWNGNKKENQENK